MAVHNKNTQNIWIYGIHPADKLLSLGRRDILKVLVTEKAFVKFSDKISKLNCKKIKAHEFTGIMGEDVNHQGIALLINVPEYQDINSFYKNDSKSLVILDQITDVGNIGAIIRSMVAFGIKDLVITEHNSVSDYGKILKSSAGLAEYLNIYKVTNLSKLISDLKKKEFWNIGLAGEARADISEVRKFDKIAVVLGSEGQGIRDLVKKNCDLLVKIPMSNDAESLNVSAAAAICFYNMVI